MSGCSSELRRVSSMSSCDSNASVFVRQRSLPPIPRLEIDPFYMTPFSDSFPGLVIEDDMQSLRGCSSLEMLDRTYHLEHYTNIKDLDPDWDDDDIDEIVVMSPKPRGRLATITEDTESGSERSACAIGLADFDILDASGTLCRKRDTHKVYAMKSSQTSSQLVWSEQSISTVVNRLNTPFLPKMHWSFQDDGLLYMITDFYPGGSLLSHVTQNGALKPERALFYASEIISGISNLHVAKIMHRDLNPENVMIDARGHIVLTNFRCAKLSDPKDFRHHRRIVSAGGKKEYQAPEMLLGWTHDFSVDCWGFGILLYFMLFGTNPFGDVDSEMDHGAMLQKILHADIPFQSSPRIDSAAQGLITKCLERNPIIRLKLHEIKSHSYFVAVNWRLVAGKGIRVPYLPELDVRKSHIEPPKKAVVHNGSSNPSRRLSQTAEIDLSTNKVDPFARPARRQSLPKIFRMSSLSVGPSVAEISLQEAIALEPTITHLVDTTALQTDRANEITAQERMALFWEMFDSDQDVQSSTSSPVAGDPLSSIHLPLARKLRKRSSIIPERLSAAISTSHNKLRKKVRPTSDAPWLSPRPHAPFADLPGGIEQVGDGIGYTYNIPAAARSKVSICTTSKPTTCRGIFPVLTGFGIGLGLRLGNGLGITRKSKGKARTPRLGQGTFGNSQATFGGMHDDIYQGGDWSPAIPMADMISPLSGHTTQSLMSDGALLTPDSVHFKDGQVATISREAKTDDPDTTLRLVSPSDLEMPLSPTMVHGFRPVHPYLFGGTQ